MIVPGRKDVLRGVNGETTQVGLFGGDELDEPFLRGGRFGDVGLRTGERYEPSAVEGERHSRDGSSGTDFEFLLGFDRLFAGG